MLVDILRRLSKESRCMKVLVIDIGGTNVKILATGQTEARRFPSGPTMTPARWCGCEATWPAAGPIDAVSIGYPGGGARQAGGRAAQPGPGLGRLRLRGSLRLPGEDHQRRGHAGTGQLSRQDACCSWAWAPGWAPRWWSTAVVEPMELAHLPYREGTHLRGLRGRAGATARSAREVAQARRRRGGTAAGGPASRRRGAGRRQRQDS